MLLIKLINFLNVFCYLSELREYINDKALTNNEENSGKDFLCIADGVHVSVANRGESCHHKVNHRHHLEYGRLIS